MRKPETKQSRVRLGMWWLAVCWFLVAGLACCGSRDAMVLSPEEQSEAPEGTESNPEGEASREALTFFVYPKDIPRLVEQGAALLDGRDLIDYRTGHIPGASHAPWTGFVDGMLTGVLTDDTAQLQKAMRESGVRNDKPVIVYGSWKEGWGEEGRLFWTMEYLGHRDVHVLYGGVDSWTEAGGETTVWAPTVEAGNFTVNIRPELRASAEDIEKALEEEGAGLVILDTRREEEFEGETPYGAARGGHIPDAEHFYWKSVFQNSGELRSPDDLRATFRNMGIEKDTLVVSYCTGGVRSGFMYMMMRWMGYENPQNYDGSWWEWAGRRELPVEK